MKLNFIWKSQKIEGDKLHVGVCMKIKAKSFQEAENKAEEILKKYSIQEEERTNEIKMSLKEFIELLGLPEDMDAEQFELLLNVQDKEEILRKALDVDTISYDESLAYISDYEAYETNKLAQFLVQAGRDIFPGVRDDNIYILAAYYDTPWDVFSFDLGRDENDEKWVYISCPYFSNAGHWDYDYGTTDSFGIGGDYICRINSCQAYDLNPLYKEQLTNPNRSEQTEHRLRTMIEFYLDFDCERIDERNLDEIKKLMLENIDSETYFITGSVHI